MKKSLVAGAVALVLLTAAQPSVAGDQIFGVDPFFGGGFEVWTLNGSYCRMQMTDPGADAVLAVVLAAAANHWPAYVTTTGQQGWPPGAWGDNTCATAPTWPPFIPGL